MPVKYIGRTTFLKGKPLWEILGNLKDYGVGRIIIRNQFARYPEPSYYKILEVTPEEDDTSINNYRKVKAKVERVFRGHKYEEPVLLWKATYKPDYELIPKSEEFKYTDIPLVQRPIKIMPADCEPPPLLKEVLKRHWKKNNLSADENFRIPLIYSNSKSAFYRKANENDNELIGNVSKPVQNNLTQ